MTGSDHQIAEGSTESPHSDLAARISMQKVLGAMPSKALWLEMRSPGKKWPLECKIFMARRTADDESPHLHDLK